jgi:hypothetical protein
MQPSAQGIASLYTGNPGALQQKIQKEQQAKPGMPPDLKKLMALNIVTNEADAAKRQQAMNALNSMAPAGQEPPTVAQSIQQQAKQKMQAKLLQEQRQQQGLAALAQRQPDQGIPEGTQFAQAQPQGIDELPVDMEFAGGGIVAFSDGDSVRRYETAADRYYRESREQAERERAERLARIEAEEGNTTSYGDQMRGLGRFIDRFVPDPVRMFRKLVSDPALAREEAAAATQAVRQDNRDALNRADAGLRSAAPELGTPAAPTSPRREPPPTTPRAAAPVTQSTPAAPAVAKSLADLVGEREALVEGARNKEMDRYGKFIPRPDTSQYDRLMAELEGRKKQFDAPKPGFEGFAEYMQQIAAAGPRRTVGEAGTAGAVALDALNKERKSQQFELTKQAIDVAQKKIDADRAYNKELYASGESGAKRMAEIAKETATEMGLDRRQQETLANQIKVANINAAASRYAADARGEGRTTMTPAQRAEIANKAKDNVQNELKTNMRLQMEARKNPGLLDILTARETERLMAAAEGRTIGPAPGAESLGGTTLKYNPKTGKIE